MSGIKLQNWFLVGFLVILLVAVARIFAPFFSVFLWSSLLYIFVNPLFKKLTSRFRKEGRFYNMLRLTSAGGLSILSVLVILVPLGFIAFQLVSQLSDVVRDIVRLLEKDPDFFMNLLSKATATINDLSMGAVHLEPGELLDTLSSALSKGMTSAVSLSSHMVRNIGSLLFSLFFTAFTLYFFLIDADYLGALLSRAIPMQKDHMGAILGKFSEITRNLVFGYIIVALFQAVMAFILFSIFSVKSSLAFAAMVAVCSLIPMIGTTIVWAPLGVAMIMQGNVISGIIFLCLSALLISTLDNFLRPLFLKDRIKLHPLVIFFAIMGGILSFGFNGLLIGPLAVILLLTVLDLFQKADRTLELPSGSE